jgi:Glycosyl transferases group 1
VEPISFWLRHERAADGIAGWDPDAEPGRFASGYGHNILELFVRLRRRGLPVSLETMPAAGAALVVIFLKSALVSRRQLRDAVAAAWGVRGRVAVIRSDAAPDERFPIRPLVEFVGSPTQVSQPWQRWLPPLPQRGMLPREPARRGSIRRLAFKGNPENVPRELLTARWAQALADRDIEWWLDVPGATDGSDQAWHDFSTVDAVLCVRHRDELRALGTEKPPTRLINAWLAGSIPIATREPSYEALATDGRDAFFVDSIWDALDVIDRLNERPLELARAEEALARRATEFTRERILRMWTEELTRAAAVHEMPLRRVTRVLGAASTLTRIRAAVRLHG